MRSKTFARSGLRISFSGIAALVFLSGCGANNSGSNSNPPPPSISVNVSPTTASLSGSGVQSFAAVVSNDSSNAGVTWSIGSGAGVLSASTLKGVTYTAPSSIGATTTVTLTATSKTDTAKTASAAITLDPPAAPPTITSVAASCVPSSVQTGQTSQCSATVTGTGNYSSAVTWSAGGVGGGNSTIGTISTAGLYTAPSVVPATNPIAVSATSTANATMTGSASVTVVAASLPQISSLSASTANPFDLLTITGSGFDYTASVNFMSAAIGFSVNLQPLYVSQTSLIVSVPVMFIGSTFTSGTVSVTVVGSSGQSNSPQIQIGAVPPAPPSAPGTVTLGFMEGELALANQFSSETTANPLSSDLAALITSLNAAIPPIESVVNGTATSADLGSLNGQPVILGVTELSQMDQLSVALLQSLADSAGNGTSTMLAGHRSAYTSAAPMSSSSSTGCVSLPAAVTSLYDVAVSGEATVPLVNANVVYLNEGLGISSAGVNIIVDTLKLAPDGIAVAAKTSATAVAPELVVAAEIYDALHDTYAVGSYLANPAHTGADNEAILSVAVGKLGLVGTIANLNVAVSQLQTDLQNLPQGIPLNPQAAACTSTLSQDFGTVVTGNASTPPRTITITSSGGAPITVTSVVIGGPIPTQSADFHKSSDTCTGNTLAVATANTSAQLCTITDYFEPTATGPESAAIGIYGNFPASPILVRLSGAGNLIASADAVTPSIPALGPVGGCAGGSVSGTINVTAATGVGWTWVNSGSTDNLGDTLTFSPAFGSGSAVVTATITVPPQVPYGAETCGYTYSNSYPGAFGINFSDGTSLATKYTLIQVFLD